MEQKFYTLLVYSENIAGILNQVTAVFTRRQVNIESLNVSASSIDGIHKYTITCWSTEDQIVKITKQLEKKIDIIKANFYTDDELFGVVLSVCQDKYNGQRPSLLPVSAKQELALFLHKEYNAGNKQIQRMLRLDPSAVAAMLPQKF